MFAVVVMPLSEFLAGDEDDFELGGELLEQFQQTLSEEVGSPVQWAEEAGAGEGDLEPDDLDPVALWALRVVAAWYEKHGTLETCEPGEEPWSHPVFEAVEDAGGSKKFRQILHADSDAVCYAPVELPDVFFLALAEEGEEEAEEEAGDEVGIGSLSALVEELEALREPLGLPEALEDIAVEEFVDDPDIPLSAAKFAWFVLRDRAKEAEAAKTPLMVIWNEFEDEEEGEQA